MIAYYDAENNTGNGHSDTTTTWKDLSGNGNDVELKNFTQSISSGWSNNSLIFDGIDDFATIKNLELSSYNDITICATFKILSMPDNKAVAVLSSENAGTGRLFFGYGDNYLNYVANSNTYAINYTQPDIWLYGDNDLAQVGKTNNIIMTYMGQNSKKTNKIFCNNNTILTNSTIMTSKWGNYSIDIGRAFGDEHLANHPHANIQLYNLFIYQGSLSNEQIQHNYNIDKYRFNITE